MYHDNISFYFLNEHINLIQAIVLTMKLSPINYFVDKLWLADDIKITPPDGYFQLRCKIIDAIAENELPSSLVIYKATEYTKKGKLKKNYNKYLINPNFTELNQR